MLANPTFAGFNTAPSYATGAGPGTINDGSILNPDPVVATFSVDMNHDGFIDLVAVQYSGTVSVLLNDGHGSFGAPVLNTEVQTGGASYSPQFESAVLQDLNGDGYPDLVVLDGYGIYSNNELWVFMNQGNGTFAAPAPLPFKTKYGSNSCGSELYNFVVGDVTTDGHPDIVGMANCGPIVTYVGDGQGHFSTVNAPETDNFTFATGSALAIQPLNGKLNLIFSAYLPNSQAGSTTLSIVGLPSNGDGTFGASQTLAIGGATMLQFQDVNGDGVPDMVFYVGDGNLYVALGKANGTFAVSESSIGGTTAVHPSQFAFVDINGDNLPDLIDAEAGNVSIYLNDGDGTFGGSAGLATANYVCVFDFSGLNNLTIADFNGDGKPDFALTDFLYGRTAIYLNNGSGNFQASTQLAEESPTPAIPSELFVTTALDVNGDGKQDILAVNFAPEESAGGSLQVQSGVSDGKGGFTYKTALSGSSILNLEDILPETGDFNGDGLQDVILYSDSAVGAPVISVSLSNGDGTFQHPVAVQLSNSPRFFPSNIVVGDINGDGKQDLVIAYQGDGTVNGVPSGYYTVLGNGDGTFKTATFTPYGTELYIPLLADINGDGFLDLILADNPVDYGGTSPFQVTALFGDGKGDFSSTAPLTLNKDNLIENAFAVDLDQDGRPDLVLFTNGQVDYASFSLVPDTEGISILSGKGGGIFTTSPLLAQGIEPFSGAVADVNGDGIPDILFGLYNDSDDRTETYYGLSTLLGNGDGTFTKPSNMNSIVFAASDPILPGDFLGDGSLGVVAVGGYGSSLLLNRAASNSRLLASLPSLSAGQQETLTATVTAAIASQPVPTGLVTFFLGTNVLGQTKLSGGVASLSISTLPIGSNQITISYSGDSAFNPAVHSASVKVVVGPAMTITTVQVSPNPAASGATITLLASVASVWQGTASGTVTFYDGTSQLSIANLVNGTASYSSSLALGSHSIAATYSGDNSFASGTSPSVVELIEAGGISLSLNPSTLDMASGQAGTVTLAVSANATYSGNVSLAASGVPANTSISFSSHTVMLTGSQTQLVTIAIATDTTSTTSLAASKTWAASAGLSCAGLLLMFLPCKRRFRFANVISIAALALLMSTAGCAGKSITTPKGTSVVTITATPSGATSAVQTTLNLIVR